MANIPGKTTDEIFMEDLRQEFMESVSIKLKEMRLFFNRKDYAAIAMIAHDIKGTSGVFVGLAEGTEIAKELLQAIEDEKIEEINNSIDKLTVYMRKNGVDI